MILCRFRGLLFAVFKSSYQDFARCTLCRDLSTNVGIINSKSREEIYDKYEIWPRSSKLGYRPFPHSSKQRDLFKARNDKIKLFA